MYYMFLLHPWPDDPLHAKNPRRDSSGPSLRGIRKQARYSSLPWPVIAR